MNENINSEDLGQELIDAGFGIDVESMDIEQLTSDDTLIRIFSISDNVERERYISKLRNRAQKLQKTRSFNNVLKAFQQSYIQEKKRTGAKNIKFTDTVVTIKSAVNDDTIKDIKKLAEEIHNA